MPLYAEEIGRQRRWVRDPLPYGLRDPRRPVAVLRWSMDSPGQAYNVGSDEEICIRDLAQSGAGCPLAPRTKPVKIAGKVEAGEIPRSRYVPSIDKARRELDCGRLSLSGKPCSKRRAMRRGASRHARGQGCAVAFDFDGTLVDSALGIVHGLSLALDRNQVRPVPPLDRRLIGPPLPVTLAKVSGKNDPDLLALLLPRDFIPFYDAGACLDAPAFPGVGATLVELHRRGMTRYLVTNKRGVPTRKMLDHLGWPPCSQQSTASMNILIARTSRNCSPRSSRRIRFVQPRLPDVGDTDGDARSARAQAMPFIQVAWGYGDLLDPGPERVCTDPGELLSMIGTMTGTAP